MSVPTPVKVRACTKKPDANGAKRHADVVFQVAESGRTLCPDSYSFTPACACLQVEQQMGMNREIGL